MGNNVTKIKRIEKPHHVKRFPRFVTSGVYDPRRDGVSQSLAGIFLQCRQKFALRVNGWVPAGWTGNTFFGSLFHEFLDRYYSGENNLKKIIDESETAVIKKEKEENPAADEMQMAADCALAEATFFEYVEHYAESETLTPKGRRIAGRPVVFTEGEFDRFDGAINARLVGKRDGGYKNAEGLLRLIEHKTKSRFDEENTILSLTFDTQNLFYLYNTVNELNAAVSGVLYNIIRRPQLRRGANETLLAFVCRVREDIQKRPEYYFVRYDIDYTEMDVINHVEQFSQIIKNMENMIYNREIAYRTTAACLSPFKCEYLEACSSSSVNCLSKTEKLFHELSIE